MVMLLSLALFVPPCLIFPLVQQTAEIRIIPLDVYVCSMHVRNEYNALDIAMHSWYFSR